MEGAARISPSRELGYAEYGDLDGQPLLWLHGTPGGRRQVPIGIHAAGREHGFRVIAVERPGTGRSTDHRHRRIRDFGTDLGHFADAMGLDTFAVVGLSGGGPYTLAAAHENPDRVPAVAILGGLAPTTGPEAVFSFHGLTRLAQPVLEGLRRTVVPAMNFGLSAARPVADPVYRLYVKVNGRADTEVMVDPAVRDMFLDDLLGAEAIRAPFHDLALFGRYWGFRIGDIATPVLVWHGDADHIVPYPQGVHIVGLLPRAYLYTVPDLGHFAGYTQADTVLGELRRIIRGEHHVVSEK